MMEARTLFRPTKAYGLIRIQEFFIKLQFRLIIGPRSKPLFSD